MDAYRLGDVVIMWSRLFLAMKGPTIINSSLLVRSHPVFNGTPWDGMGGGGGSN